MTKVVPYLKRSMKNNRPNSVLRYLYNMAVGLVIYSKARAFKTKARESQGQEIWP